MNIIGTENIYEKKRKRKYTICNNIKRDHKKAHGIMIYIIYIFYIFKCG